jgi:methionyl-tRNA formyltransferase
MTKVVFMGSPDFAVPTLRALLEAEDMQVVGVVTQPDRPAGRGVQLKMQPVKVLALEYGLDIYQPEKLRGSEAVARLADWGADVYVVAAFGQILRKDVLTIPPFGLLNVHASLLPRWRGAAPLQAAIRAGDSESGVTIMKIDEGLDTGDMLLKEAIPLDPRETGGTLHDKLAELGASLLMRALRGYLAGEIIPQPQDHSQATFAPQIEKHEGQIDWRQPADAIDRHVRAFTPVPGTYTFWDGRRLKIIAGMPLKGSLPVGKIGKGDGEYPLVIGTGAGVFAPTLLQLEGKNRLDAKAFLNGNADILGGQLEYRHEK